MLQNPEEFSQLLDLYKDIKPNRVLEIGVKEGGTLSQWIKYAQPDATIVAVDDCKHADVSEEFKWQCYFIKGDSHSQNVVDQVNSFGQFDFVFIDGDHTYGGVTKDWWNYGLADVVAFHDIVPHEKQEDNGPSILWQELKSKFETKEFVKDWNQGRYGIGVVLQ